MRLLRSVVVRRSHTTAFWAGVKLSYLPISNLPAAFAPVWHCTQFVFAAVQASAAGASVPGRAPEVVVLPPTVVCWIVRLCGSTALADSRASRLAACALVKYSARRVALSPADC